MTLGVGFEFWRIFNAGSYVTVFRSALLVDVKSRSLEIWKVDAAITM